MPVTDGLPVIRPEAAKSAFYNHSPDTDILATNNAPQVITSAKTIKLVAYHRKPFIHQIQSPHETTDPYVTTSNQCSADGLGG